METRLKVLVSGISPRDSSMEVEKTASTEESVEVNASCGTWGVLLGGPSSSVESTELAGIVVNSKLVMAVVVGRQSSQP